MISMIGDSGAQDGTAAGADEWPGCGVELHRSGYGSRPIFLVTGNSRQCVHVVCS